MFVKIIRIEERKKNIALLTLRMEEIDRAIRKLDQQLKEAYPNEYRSSTMSLHKFA